jgi:hypothetical protein
MLLVMVFNGLLMVRKVSTDIEGKVYEYVK